MSTPKRLPLDARAVGWMGLLSALWGLQQVSMKDVAAQASPMLMVSLRSVIAAALLWALMRWRGERLQRARWPAGALVGALFALEYVLVGQALTMTQASQVLVFLYTGPIFAALGLHWRLPAERLVAVAWVGIALAFAGMALAFLGGQASATDAASLRSGLGSALALVAGVAWGATTVAIRCSALARAPATETLLYQLLGAAAWLLPAAALSGQWHWSVNATTLAHLGFQAVVISFASFLVWFWLLTVYPASQLGVFSFLTPLIGVGLGVALLGERLDAHFVIGSALVLAGIVGVSGQAALTRWLGRALNTISRAPAPSRR